MGILNNLKKVQKDVNELTTAIETKDDLVIYNFLNQKNETTIDEIISVNEEEIAQIVSKGILSYMREKFPFLTIKKRKDSDSEIEYVLQIGNFRRSEDFGIMNTLYLNLELYADKVENLLEYEANGTLVPEVSDNSVEIDTITRKYEELAVNLQNKMKKCDLEIQELKATEETRNFFGRKLREEEDKEAKIESILDKKAEYSTELSKLAQTRMEELSEIETKMTLDKKLLKEYSLKEAITEFEIDAIVEKYTNVSEFTTELIKLSENYKDYLKSNQKVKTKKKSKKEEIILDEIEKVEDKKETEDVK